MNRGPMSLVKFVCVAKTHAGARREAGLTIHDRAWAFCPMGASSKGHEWQPSDGLPIADALRFTPRQQEGAVPAGSPAPTSAHAASANGRARRS